jgi:DNA-binding transcriptional LysR family regulator
MLKVQRLTVLARFAARGSIVAVAEELGVSPSAVSQQLTTLEREVGLPLIERTSHSASLTDAGHELVGHASVILAAIEAAETSMRARVGTIGGRVRVSFIPGLAATAAPDLAELQGRHPALTVVAVQIDSTEAAAALLDRSTDVAVIDEWGEEPVPHAATLRVHRGVREQIVLGVPADHPVAAAHLDRPVSAATLRELVLQETWLSAPPGEVSRIAGDARLAQAGAIPLRRWEFEGLYVLARLVAVGAGVALLPSSTASYERNVAAIPMQPRMYRHVRVLTRATTRDDPAVAACIKAIQKGLRRPWSI